MNGGIHSNQLYYYDNYMKPEQQQQQLANQQTSHHIYMNGVGSQQMNNDQMQHQYAVVKKSGSKRDINTIERENPALFKVNFNGSISPDENTVIIEPFEKRKIHHIFYSIYDFYNFFCLCMFPHKTLFFHFSFQKRCRNIIWLTVRFYGTADLMILSMSVHTQNRIH